MQLATVVVIDPKTAYGCAHLPIVRDSKASNKSDYMEPETDPPPSEVVRAGLVNSAATHMHALYRFGDGERDNVVPGLANLELLALVRDSSSITPLRAAFLPLWQQVGHRLQQPLAAATPASWQRHLELDPLLGHRQAQYGRLLWGTAEPYRNGSASARSQAAFAADVAMQASEALTAAVLSSTEAQEAVRRLRGVARFLGHSPDGAMPAQLFAAIQTTLSPLLPLKPETTSRPLLPDAPSLLPELQAIYEKADRLIFVLPEMPASRWESINWHAVADTIAGQCAGLQLATPAQLRLVVSHQYPVHYTLRSYRHIWGRDLLAGLSITRRRLWQDAARLPSLLETVELPQSYLSATDDELSRVIHDFQNKLLNVQLRHELLLRMKMVRQITPPPPLPPRTESAARRIAGIFQHLNFWANFYTDLMRHEPAA